jgi:hypothetical protein
MRQYKNLEVLIAPRLDGKSLVVPEKLVSNKFVEFFERIWLIFNTQ